MEYVKALAITIGYSVDVFIASVSFGLMIRKLTSKKIIGISMIFAIIQSVAAWLSYQLLDSIASYLECINHWVSFVALLLIGIFMLIHSYHNVEFDQKESKLRWVLVILVSAATTTDIWSLVTKDTMIQIVEWTGILIIGIEAILSSVLGILLGHYLGVRYRYKSEFAAGILLIVLAIKLLFVGVFRCT